MYVDAAFKRAGVAGLAVVGSHTIGVNRRAAPAVTSMHAEALAVAWAFEILLVHGVYAATVHTDCSDLRGVMRALRAGGGEGLAAEALRPVVETQRTRRGLFVCVVPRVRVEEAHAHARRALRDAMR